MSERYYANENIQGHSRPPVDPFDDPFFEQDSQYAPEAPQQSYQPKQSYIAQQQYLDPNAVQYSEVQRKSQEYPQQPQINVDFFNQSDYSLPRFNSEVASNQKSFGNNYASTNLDTIPRKRQHFKVDSFFDNIPATANAKEPIGTLEEFFEEFNKKTTVSDIPVRKNTDERSKIDIQKEQLERLKKFGFEEEERNKQLLKAYDGDLDKVVKHLIDLERLKNRVAEKKEKEQKPIKSTTSSVPVISSAIAEQKFEIRVGELKNLTYTVNIYDEKDSLSHKAVLLLHSCIILKDRSNQTISRVVKDDLHLHPTYSISRSGKRLAQCSERFKFGAERKFNYRMFTGDVLKMTGMYGKDWIIKRNGTVLAHITQKATKRYEVVTKSQLVSHILTLCMIMLERRYTSMRAVVLV
jgi:uncharacterized protein YxjI